MVVQLKLFYTHPQSGALLYEKVDVHKDDTLGGATDMGYKVRMYLFMNVCVCMYVRMYVPVLCCATCCCYLFCFNVVYLFFAVILVVKQLITVCSCFIIAF